MKYFFLMTMMISSAHAQKLWERNEKLVCYQTKTNVDEVRVILKNKYKKDCDYFRDSTRIAIGNIFKCPDEKIYPYFRTEVACQMFFREGKKDLLKFAPAGNANPQKWINIFGSCMETASQKQVNNMGLQTLNSFCYCVADTTSDKITSAVVQNCSKKLKAN